MLNRKHWMYFVAFAMVALISVVLASFHGGVIPRLLDERVLPSSASPAPSAAAAQEKPILRAFPTANAPQPARNFVLTSERFVKNANELPVKPRDNEQHR